MKTEIILAFLHNISAAAQLLALFSVVGLVISLIAKTVMINEEKRLREKVGAEGKNSYSYSDLLETSSWLAIWSYWNKFALKVAAIAVPIALIPSTDQIWKIRIDLIKFELSSPENIKQGAEAINRIAEKLECKYLGCDKEEKK